MEFTRIESLLRTAHEHNDYPRFTLTNPTGTIELYSEEAQDESPSYMFIKTTLLDHAPALAEIFCHYPQPPFFDSEPVVPMVRVFTNKGGFQFYKGEVTISSGLDTLDETVDLVKDLNAVYSTYFDGGWAQGMYAAVTSHGLSIEQFRVTEPGENEIEFTYHNNAQDGLQEITCRLTGGFKQSGQNEFQPLLHILSGGNPLTFVEGENQYVLNFDGGPMPQSTPYRQA